MFSICSSLEQFPNISKWTIENVTDMSGMFSNYTENRRPLNSITNTDFLSKISDNPINYEKLNIIYIGDQIFKFYKESCLTLLPDISNWNTKSVVKMDKLYDNRILNISLNKWDFIPIDVSNRLPQIIDDMELRLIIENNKNKVEFKEEF